MALSDIPQDDAALVARVRSFVRDAVLPFEKDPRNGSHGPTEELRRQLNAMARDAGLLSLQVSPRYGGRGLSQVQRAGVFEAAGYSPLGPVALNCAAPDEGNMHLLEEVATPEQKERFLKPLADGSFRSCFAMTEPSPGAGSDPSLMLTTASGDGRAFEVNGKKWLITGAAGAGFMILMARTVVRGEDIGATMFLVPLPNPGIVLERLIDSLDSSFTEGHAQVSIKNLRLSSADVLGEVGKGFAYAQVRLAPARLTHCMRWLGAGTRAQDIALQYAATRSAFGKAIGEHEGIGFQLADNDMDLHLARLTTLDAARVLDQGRRGGFESSRAKVMVSEALFRVADRCVQILGGLGLTADTVVAQIFRELRAFRIYDGPSEVHRWSIARRLLKDAGSRPAGAAGPGIPS
jgi:acyl-CoA dehydrogenase